MFCMFCGAKITSPDPVFCSHCGKNLVTGTEAGTGERSVNNFENSQDPTPALENRMPARPLPPWNDDALRCASYTFGPHVHKYKIHGTCNSPEGNLSGTVALTLTGFEFISKAGDMRIYYQSIVRAVQTSSSTIAIETNDGGTYEFKLAVPKAWIEKIEEMAYFPS